MMNVKLLASVTLASVTLAPVTLLMSQPPREGSPGGVGGSPKEQRGLKRGRADGVTPKVEVPHRARRRTRLHLG